MEFDRETVAADDAGLVTHKQPDSKGGDMQCDGRMQIRPSTNEEKSGLGGIIHTEIHRARR
ncbi:hypothetical protein, partial [Cupriavidus pauculus]|uniref:hypothetical protein n=1 Tax=Cupriavidus pauculus TaxID=82633 RepID=UPI0030FB9470